MNLSYLSLRTFSYTCLALLALFLAFSNSSDVSWNLSLTPSNLEKKISLFHTIERKIMSKHSINTNARHLLIQVLISHLFSVPLYVPVCIITKLIFQTKSMTFSWYFFLYAFPSLLNANSLFHRLHVGCINSIKIGIHVTECFCHDLCLFFDIFWSIQLQNPLTCTCKSRKKYKK